METYSRERRIERVTLQQPVPAKADGERAYVVDASMRGVRLSHTGLLPQGKQCGVTFEWDGRPIELVGQVRWTRAQRTPSNLNVYLSGLEITNIKFDSEAALRRLVEAFVERALDERKANARGIPPVAATHLSSETPELFARHEWIDGMWRKTLSSDSSQPRSGFTVLSNESRHQVLMLQSAYEVADEGLQNLIRRLASMSIADDASMPARRYKP